MIFSLLLFILGLFFLFFGIYLLRAIKNNRGEYVWVGEGKEF